MAAAARALGIVEQTPGNWVKAEKAGQLRGVKSEQVSAERMENNRLHQARPKRADAQRKMSALLEAAMEVFQTSGVDAPVPEIAEKARVGLGTVDRHFPQRTDLIKAVFQSQVDACADAAAELSSQYEPGDALARWMQRYVDFISTKRGLGVAIHSGGSEPGG